MTATTMTPPPNARDALKSITPFINNHSFFRSLLDDPSYKRKTSKVKQFKRDVYHFSRAHGLSKQQAESQGARAERICDAYTLGSDATNDTVELLGSSRKTRGSSASDIPKRSSKRKSGVDESLQHKRRRSDMNAVSEAREKREKATQAVSGNSDQKRDRNEARVTKPNSEPKKNSMVARTAQPVYEDTVREGYMAGLSKRRLPEDREAIHSDFDKYLSRWSRIYFPFLMPNHFRSASITQEAARLLENLKEERTKRTSNVDRLVSHQGNRGKVREGSDAGLQRTIKPQQRGDVSNSESDESNESSDYENGRAEQQGSFIYGSDDRDDWIEREGSLSDGGGESSTARPNDSKTEAEAHRNFIRSNKRDPYEHHTSAGKANTAREKTAKRVSELDTHIRASRDYANERLTVSYDIGALEPANKETKESPKSIQAEQDDIKADQKVEVIIREKPHQGYPSEDENQDQRSSEHIKSEKHKSRRFTGTTSRHFQRPMIQNA